MKISITVDTKDADALTECAELMMKLAGTATADGTLVDNRPTLAVVPPKMYEVDGREYTAEQVRQGGWAPARLLELGWPPAKIAEVLEITLDEVTTPSAPQTEQVVAAEVFAPTTGDAVALDSKGMPWDTRIHAGTKTMVGDGTWKYKRNTDPAIIEQVEAELINLMSLEPTAAPVVIQPPVITPAQAADNVVLEPKVIPPPANAIQPPAVVVEQPAAEPAMTFAAFLKACSAKMTAGDTTLARINAVVNNKGIASLQLVNNRPELIPELWAEIEAHTAVA